MPNWMAASVTKASRVSPAIPAIGFGHPVPDRLGGRFKLSGQILRVAAGTDQIDWSAAGTPACKGDVSWA